MRTSGTTKTPVEKQYAEMKQKHPDAILLFRVGDFYETFADDAISASDILGITLTRRHKADGTMTELAGFPHHALDKYLPMLVRAGKRVAICEQLEAPKPKPSPRPASTLPPLLKPEPKPIDIKPVITAITALVGVIDTLHKWQEIMRHTQDIRDLAQSLKLPLKRVVDMALKEVLAPPVQPSLFDVCEPQSDYASIPQIKLSYVSDSKPKVKIKGSKDTAELFRQSFEPGEIEMREYFKVMYLNRANKVLGINIHSMGGSASTVVDLKLILSGALLANASSIIVCHNHPSGNLIPSAHDDTLTQRIKEGCKSVELALLDHIIITQYGYYSYNDEGKL